MVLSYFNFFPRISSAVIELVPMSIYAIGQDLCGFTYVDFLTVFACSMIYKVLTGTVALRSKIRIFSD